MIFFSTDGPWYNIKKYQRVLLASEWFSSKKLPKFREPVQGRHLTKIQKGQLLYTPYNTGVQ
jgi:hypothetical protein